MLTINTVNICAYCGIHISTLRTFENKKDFAFIVPRGKWLREAERLNQRHGRWRHGRLQGQDPDGAEHDSQNICSWKLYATLLEHSAATERPHRWLCAAQPLALSHLLLQWPKRLQCTKHCWGPVFPLQAGLLSRNQKNISPHRREYILRIWYVYFL